MTVLALLRHAEATKQAPGGDHARPLSQAGRGAATAVGERLTQLLPSGTALLVSDAARTRETAALAFPTWEPAHVTIEEAIYEAHPEALLSLLRALPPGLPGAVLVGHNPGISVLAALLAAGGPASDPARLAQGLATAEAALFRFDSDWAGLAPHACVLVGVLDGKPDQD
ncbi:histidine phosphatase family protein [Lichenihabitans sp. Uapishka_5]|uniref:SixA phosphatase family protein n=1 Tax=Lichenihabitans sp. Uapishka_5 TaxID=3037302 RepID=UPI0029E7CBE5|nr:histidine phosphatase family protein [Lichenihabitans sp. Uapishka_5]MDX7949684.1 histidine phosphatase family protein [Lichenihabitans sp. Uapishka_5]